MLSRIAIALVFCLAAGAVAQPAEISGELTRHALAPHASYYEDPGLVLTIDDVSAPGFAANFTASNAEELHFGLTRSAFWIRVDIDWRDDALSLPWVLEIGPPKHVEGIARGGSDIHVFGADGQQRHSERLGRYTTAEELKTLSGGYALRLNPQTDRQIYLRIESARDLRLPITLWQEGAFRENETNVTVVFGIKYGILLAMICYNLFLFFSIRERSYFYYVLAITAQLGFLFLDSKHARFVNDAEWINPWIINIMERDIYILMGITTLLFHRSLLQVATYNFSLDRTIRWLIALFALSLPLSLLEDEKIVQSVYLALIVATILLVFYTNFDAIRRGIRTARVHLAASTVLLLGASVQMSYQVWRLVPGNWFTMQAYELAMLAHVLLLSFGLAFRYNSLRTEKEEAQQMAIENLRKSDRIKDELLANISHELRTPVYGINGLAEMALKSASTLGPQSIRTIKQNLELISSSGARLIGLIDNLLDFSAVRHNALPLELKSVDIRSLTSLVLAINAPMAVEKSLQVINNVSAELPPVLADEDRLHQILLNLVTNATKFTNQGEITVSANLIQPDTVRIIVSDTGPGISQEDQRIIFNAFEKGGAAPDGRGGVGLGLAIARSLVKLHGGDLVVSSEPGKGAQFSFCLPVADTSARNLYPTANRALVRRSDFADKPQDQVPTTSVPATQKSAATILIVDDENTNRVLMAQQLEMYNVEQVGSGADAIAAIEQRRPDLVLLDLMMPGMNGHETCQAIRKQYNEAELPIIIVTARNHLEDLTHGFKTGANDFLSKPFYAEELLARVSNQLKLADLQRLNLDNAKLQNQIASYVDAAQQLRAATHQYQQLLEGMNTGFIAFSYPGVIVYMNQLAADRLGISPEHVIGQSLASLLPEVETNTAVLQLLSAWDSGESVNDARQRFDVELHLSGGQSVETVVKLTARISLLSDDESTGILFIEGSGTADSLSASQETTFDMIEVLDMAQRNVRSLSSRLKLIAPRELQEHPELLEKLNSVNDIIDFLDRQLPNTTNQDDYRQQLVSLMVATLHTWEATTHKSKIELAEESNIWVVSVDDGRLRTRTFDRYLRIDLLPKIPRWREVIRTAYFVLSNPSIEPEMRRNLESELNKTKSILQTAAIS
ncbi:MAG: 7TM diverse intracellular signaling domain-containing protein [Gammaproteobacteria bacterium]|nr:7TM diverse intracellular signaling domain-containing protein [Gammaproteobacteria bacterium]MDP2346303.1 7TM diverse intracellular signaling domain-containing protein [Gammaproteobacteria bacterium]